MGVFKNKSFKSVEGFELYKAIVEELKYLKIKKKTIAIENTFISQLFLFDKLASEQCLKGKKFNIFSKTILYRKIG